ncbi:hypothetical protein Acr_01g0014490 [Actinidia rufa]|uniref:Uncharacterized protein n=1 Tax=Actinidia rufa TaxID=165716 RepID=A0A7J0E5E5_9ERIC|nr:hypothetical protein Acr_01g0014490 [Actinidia rufa]
METGGNSSISDWDRPFTDEELDAIEAAFQSATSSSSSSSLSSSSPPIKRRHVPIRNGDSEGGRPTVRRLLPESISGKPPMRWLDAPLGFVVSNTVSEEPIF